MSMPELPTPNPELTREQALNMILSSIAMEEIALSHIINAEGEKIQYILQNPSKPGCCADTDDILAVNKSVTNLLEVVMQNQMLLKGKMEKVLEYLPKPPSPPNPPKPPCPPPHPEPICCIPTGNMVDFKAIPGTCYCGGALSWKEQPCACVGISCCAENPTQILLPRFCCLTMNFVVECSLPKQTKQPVVLELQIACPEKLLISKSFYHTGNGCRFSLSGSAVIHQRSSYPFCNASLFLRSPHKIQIEAGRITLSCC